jgi:hypothetical protein
MFSEMLLRLARPWSPRGSRLYGASSRGIAVKNIPVFIREESLSPARRIEGSTDRPMHVPGVDMAYTIRLLLVSTY